MNTNNVNSEFASEARRWNQASWRHRYSYTFTWLGRPIIQLPDDLLRLQEVVFQVKPDVIVETGIAHGGSLIFSASLCKLLDKGRVIGVDIKIHPNNREEIEKHFLSPLITLIEGSSIERNVYQEVESHIKPGEKVLVILDSCHTYEHVMEELKLYSKLVSEDSYIVATDGVMKDLVGQEGAEDDWKTNNPFCAAADFVNANSEFVIESPKWMFDESRGLAVEDAPSYWPGAWIRRVKLP